MSHSILKLLFNFFVQDYITEILCATLSPVLVTLGFDSSAYSVREDAGSISVSVSVMSGTVSQDVTVTLSMATDGTATGAAQYNIHLHTTPLTFCHSDFKRALTYDVAINILYMVMCL